MGRIVQVLFSRFHGLLYRLLRGRMPGSKNMFILKAKGRTSGKIRQVPLIYVEDEGRYAIVASRGGSDHPPVWWLNLQANPDATVQIRGEEIAVTAAEAGPEDRERLWKELAAIYPTYDKYAAKTERRIPVVLLTRRGH